MKNPFSPNFPKMEIKWGNVPILNERPDGMSREDYKLHQKAYKALLKLHRYQGIITPDE
jgi:hypothetical protein